MKLGVLDQWGAPPVRMHLPQDTDLDHYVDWLNSRVWSAAACVTGFLLRFLRA
jgi:hypothetical protein